MSLTLERLNAADRAGFTALLDGTFEHSPWVVERAFDHRPAGGFASLPQLKRVFAEVLREAGRDAQLTLIRAHTEERLPWWQFFNGPSWIVMGVMMGGGLVLRHSGVMPEWMIAFFYTGLGLALLLCGVRFLRVFARKDVLAVGPAAEA